MARKRRDLEMAVPDEQRRDAAQHALRCLRVPRATDDREAIEEGKRLSRRLAAIPSDDPVVALEEAIEIAAAFRGREWAERTADRGLRAWLETDGRPWTHHSTVVDEGRPA